MCSDETTENEPLIPGGWRVARDEPPPEHEDILVATTHHYGVNSDRRTILRAEYVGDGYFHSDGVEWPITSGSVESKIYHRVTHWAPIPDLPEKMIEKPERGEVKPGTDERLNKMTPDG